MSHPPLRSLAVHQSIKEKVALLVEQALSAAIDGNELDLGGSAPPRVLLDRPKSKEHGDFATNLAMVLARPARQSPRKIAELLMARLATVDKKELLESIEVAGPGFINLRVKPSAWFKALGEVRKRGESFGRQEIGRGKKVNVEYISANPTGPLHVGHGRGAVTGDVCASLLQWTGFEVTREYYVNDFGNQVDTLARTVHVRYLQFLGEDVPLPEDAYPGEYVIPVARALLERDGDRWKGASEADWRPEVRTFAVARMLELIKEDLAAFNMHFDVYSSERDLHEDGAVSHCLDLLGKKGLLYEAEGGGRLFRSTEFGDDKDRAVVKRDGAFTYLAGDMAYHLNKMERGFQWLVNVWGADHAGYIPRMKAAVEALGGRPDLLEVITVQLVHLTRGGQPVRMGKRTGDFVTLRDVIDEVGRDATRLLFIARRSDAQLEFDLELAKRQSMDNPVYYVQYGHARICAILRRAQEEGHVIPQDVPSPDVLAALGLPEELDLAKRALSFPEVVAGAAQSLEPHRMVFYLQETIAAFHAYYTRYKNTDRVLSEDEQKTTARLFLVGALRQVLKNGLAILGVDAPERMDRPPEDD